MGSISRSSEGSGAAVMAGFLGWSLDAFDYFLVVMALPAIAKTYNKSVAEMAICLTVTLAFRPVGALIFGLIADRYGRRIPLMIDLVFYSLVEVLSGLAPNFTTFLILRALFGIGMGGEWGVGASLTMEKVPARLRGFLSGLLQEGYAFGYLLAALAYKGVYPYYGWRPLFFIGGVPALLAIFVRVAVKESEVWQKNKADSWKNLFRGLAVHWPIFVYLVLLMAMMNLSSHGTQDLYPTFLQKYHGVSDDQKSNLVMISMIGAIVGGMLFGRLSDRIGRRNGMTIAFIGALAAIPLWAFPPTIGRLACGAFLIQFMVQGAWGIIPAHISELSPHSIRGSMPGFAYQCGNLLASYVTPLQASLVQTHHLDYARVMGTSVGVIFLVAIIVTRAGPERRGHEFHES
jgi:SHS family lactate transporter-like MFS transporter